MYQATSAFSPIVNPVNCPWGQKAFKTYLGEDNESWSAWDSVELIKQGHQVKHLFVDQGLADNFLDNQLKTDALKQACESKQINLELKYRQGYDHSYYYISSFIGEHIKWHAQFLN